MSTPTRAPRVALLGTGTMGAAMARNIAAAGLELTVWNRSRDKADALSDVATVADSAAEAVEGADVVVTMLFDAQSVMETMGSAEGHFAEGAVWLQQSTVGAEGSDWVGACAAELGLELLDAPVLGTKQPAEQGQLTVLVAGPSALRERVEPVLDAVGQRTVWVDEEPGAASRLKLACNAWVFTVVQGTADSLALARELGVDPSRFLEAVAGSAVDAPYVQVKGSSMLEGGFDPSFALSGALKDVDLMLAAAHEAGVSPALLPALRERFARGVDEGHGDADMSVTYLLR